MSSERSIEDAIAAYAIDALSPEERAEVEAAVQSDSRLARQLDEHRQVTAALAAGSLPADPEDPPKELWDRIQRSLSEPYVDVEAEALQKAEDIEKAAAIEKAAEIAKAEEIERAADIERAAAIEKAEEIERAADIERAAAIEKAAEIAKAEEIEKVESVEEIAKAEEIEKVESVEEIAKAEEIEGVVGIEPEGPPSDTMEEADAAQVTELRPRRAWVGRAVAGLSIAAALVIGVVLVQAVLDGDPTVEQAAASARADSASEQVRLEGSVEFDVVLAEDGLGYVFGEELPALPADRTYQLWAIVEGEVTSAGILGNRPGVARFQVVGPLDGLAITEEAEGGVITSANEPIAVWLNS